MNNIVLAVIALALLGAGVWYFVAAEPEAEEVTTTEVSSEVADDSELEKVSGVGSLAALMEAGDSITCSYSFSDESMTGTGIGYFADGSMRLDAEMTYEGDEFNSHMIHDGTTLYMWGDTDEAPYALKMPAPETDTLLVDEEGSIEQSQIDLDQEVTYDCEAWNIEGSVFVPPSDIAFVDYAAQMEAMFENLPEGFELPEGFPNAAQ
ncbi:hypothetical protein N9L26_01015 [Candidatus Pacebacteria bacterium]|nr:hypothetical protein [Candidatus Paceibacterota bacterium]